MNSKTDATETADKIFTKCGECGGHQNYSGTLVHTSTCTTLLPGKLRASQSETREARAENKRLNDRIFLLEERISQLSHNAPVSTAISTEEAARLQKVIANLTEERNNAVNEANSMRAQNKRLIEDAARKLKHIADLQDVIAKRNAEIDDLQERLGENDEDLDPDAPVPHTPLDLVSELRAAIKDHTDLGRRIEKIRAILS